jgi:hypothetical protein
VENAESSIASDRPGSNVDSFLYTFTILPLRLFCLHSANMLRRIVALGVFGIFLGILFLNSISEVERQFGEFGDELKRRWLNLCFSPSCRSHVRFCSDFVSTRQCCTDKAAVHRR